MLPFVSVLAKAKDWSRERILLVGRQEPVCIQPLTKAFHPPPHHATPPFRDVPPLVLLILNHLKPNVK